MTRLPLPDLVRVDIVRLGGRRNDFVQVGHLFRLQAAHRFRELGDALGEKALAMTDLAFWRIFRRKKRPRGIPGAV